MSRKSVNSFSSSNNRRHTFTTADTGTPVTLEEKTNHIVEYSIEDPMLAKYSYSRNGAIGTFPSLVTNEYGSSTNDGVATGSPAVIDGLNFGGKAMSMVAGSQIDMGQIGNIGSVGDFTICSWVKLTETTTEVAEVVEDAIAEYHDLLSVGGSNPYIDHTAMENLGSTPEIHLGPHNVNALEIEWLVTQEYYDSNMKNATSLLYELPATTSDVFYYSDSRSLAATDTYLGFGYNGTGDLLQANFGEQWTKPFSANNASTQSVRVNSDRTITYSHDGVDEYTSTFQVPVDVNLVYVTTSTGGQDLSAFLTGSSSTVASPAYIPATPIMNRGGRPQVSGSVGSGIFYDNATAGASALIDHTSMENLGAFPSVTLGPHTEVATEFEWLVTQEYYETTMKGSNTPLYLLAATSDDVFYFNDRLNLDSGYQGFGYDGSGSLSHGNYLEERVKNAINLGAATRGIRVNADRTMTFSYEGVDEYTSTTQVPEGVNLAYVITTATADDYSANMSASIITSFPENGLTLDSQAVTLYGDPLPPVVGPDKYIPNTVITRVPSNTETIFGENTWEIDNGRLASLLDPTGDLELAPPAANWTFEFWIKIPVTSTQDMDIIAYGNNLISLSNTTGNYALRVRTVNGEGNQTLGTTELGDYTWHHCVVTWDGTTIRGYTDGNFEGSTSTWTNTLAGTRLHIGDIGNSFGVYAFDMHFSRGVKYSGSTYTVPTEPQSPGNDTEFLFGLTQYLGGSIFSGGTLRVDAPTLPNTSGLVLTNNMGNSPVPTSAGQTGVYVDANPAQWETRNHYQNIGEFPEIFVEGPYGPTTGFNAFLLMSQTEYAALEVAMAGGGFFYNNFTTLSDYYFAIDARNLAYVGMFHSGVTSDTHPATANVYSEDNDDGLTPPAGLFTSSESFHLKVNPDRTISYSQDGVLVYTSTGTIPASTDLAFVHFWGSTTGNDFSAKIKVNPTVDTIGRTLTTTTTAGANNAVYTGNATIWRSTAAEENLGEFPNVTLNSPVSASPATILCLTTQAEYDAITFPLTDNGFSTGVITNQEDWFLVWDSRYDGTQYAGLFKSSGAAGDLIQEEEYDEAFPTLPYPAENASVSTYGFRVNHDHTITIFMNGADIYTSTGTVPAGKDLCLYLISSANNDPTANISTSTVTGQEVISIPYNPYVRNGSNSSLSANQLILMADGLTWTVETWYKFGITASCILLTTGFSKINITNAGILTFEDSTNPDGSGSAVIRTLGTTNLHDDNWHYIAVSYDGTTLRGYIDGNLEGTNVGITYNDNTSPNTTILWSRDEAFIFDMQFSNTARYTEATMSVPTAKATYQGDTVFLIGSPIWYGGGDIADNIWRFIATSYNASSFELKYYLEDQVSTSVQLPYLVKETGMDYAGGIWANTTGSLSIVAGGRRFLDGDELSVTAESTSGGVLISLVTPAQATVYAASEDWEDTTFTIWTDSQKNTLFVYSATHPLAEVTGSSLAGGAHPIKLVRNGSSMEAWAAGALQHTFADVLPPILHPALRLNNGITATIPYDFEGSATVIDPGDFSNTSNMLIEGAELSTPTPLVSILSSMESLVNTQTLFGSDTYVIDGIGNRTTMDDLPELTFNNSGVWTVESWLWVPTARTSATTIIRNGGIADFEIRVLDNNILSILHGGTYPYVGTVPLARDTWNYISVSWDGTTLRLHSNGADLVEYTGFTLSQTVNGFSVMDKNAESAYFFDIRYSNISKYNTATYDVPTQIGVPDANTLFLFGNPLYLGGDSFPLIDNSLSLDETRFYNKVLTPAEIEEIRQNGVIAYENNAEFTPFEQGDGTHIINTAGELVIVPNNGSSAELQSSLDGTNSLAGNSLSEYIDKAPTPETLSPFDGPFWQANQTAYIDLDPDTAGNDAMEITFGDTTWRLVCATIYNGNSVHPLTGLQMNFPPAGTGNTYYGIQFTTPLYLTGCNMSAYDISGNKEWELQYCTSPDDVSTSSWVTDSLVTILTGGYSSYVLSLTTPRVCYGIRLFHSDRSQFTAGDMYINSFDLENQWGAAWVGPQFTNRVTFQGSLAKTVYAPFSVSAVTPKFGSFTDLSTVQEGGDNSDSVAITFDTGDTDPKIIRVLKTVSNGIGDKDVTSQTVTDAFSSVWGWTNIDFTGSTLSTTSLNGIHTAPGTTLVDIITAGTAAHNNLQIPEGTYYFKVPTLTNSISIYGRQSISGTEYSIPITLEEASYDGGKLYSLSVDNSVYYNSNTFWTMSVSSGSRSFQLYNGDPRSNISYDLDITNGIVFSTNSPVPAQDFFDASATAGHAAFQQNLDPQTTSDDTIEYTDADATWRVVCATPHQGFISGVLIDDGTNTLAPWSSGGNSGSGVNFYVGFQFTKAFTLDGCRFKGNKNTAGTLNFELQYCTSPTDYIGENNWVTDKSVSVDGTTTTVYDFLFTAPVECYGVRLFNTDASTLLADVRIYHFTLDGHLITDAIETNVEISSDDRIVTVTNEGVGSLDGVFIETYK